MPQILQTRFGTLDYLEEDVITFSEGLIGFAQFQKYVLIRTNEEGTFRWLQAIDEPTLAFLVADPADLVPGYSIELSDSEAAIMEIGPETATLLLTTASIPPGKPQDLTLNLAGPIVINAEARIGRQLVVDSENVPVRHRVFAPEAETAKAA